MIIAKALETVLNELPITITSNGVSLTTSLKFGYGNQVELLKWVENENKKISPNKYPLVWYVLDSYTEFQGWYSTEVKLILMTNTREEVFNEWRTTNNYIGVLKPVYDLVTSTLLANGSIQVYGDVQTRFKQFDEPNYGVDWKAKTSESSDFKSKQQLSTKSISQDFVDAKVLEFKADIKIDCII
jgi:hypothetical protein